MRYRIEFLETFKADVLELEERLEAFPQKAARIFAKLDSSLEKLKTMPKLYAVYEDVPIFRKITIEDYLAFYIFDEHNGIIEVHRLIYARMDIPARLKDGRA